MSDTYSHSRLSCFENCPQRFHYRYILNIPAPVESIEAFVGKRVHEVLERLQLFVERGQVPSLRGVLHRYQQLWEEHFDAQRVRIVRSENSTDIYRQLGERCLSTYYRNHYPFDAGETLGLEERVIFDLDSSGRYRIQGIIDRLVRARDGALEIHDYKTSQRMPSQKQLDKDRQLALYQLGLRERFPDVPIVRLVWHYLAFGQVRNSTRSLEQLEALRTGIRSLIEKIESEREFAPRPGPLCAWCEYRERCPASAFFSPAALAAELNTLAIPKENSLAEPAQPEANQLKLFSDGLGV